MIIFSKIFFFFLNLMQVDGNFLVTNNLQMCSAEERMSCRFWMTWGWVNDAIIIFWVNHPFHFSSYCTSTFECTSNPSVSLSLSCGTRGLLIDVTDIKTGPVYSLLAPSVFESVALGLQVLPRLKLVGTHTTLRAYDQTSCLFYVVGW